MKLNTKNFGNIEIDEKNIITFDTPLSGLSNSKKYIIIKQDDDELFFWLQSLDENDICLCMLDVFKVLPEYNPEIAEFKLMAISDSKVSLDDIKTYNLVVIPDDIQNMTVNLLAPIVINNKTNKGAQIITNNDNELSFKIFDILKGGAK